MNSTLLHFAPGGSVAPSSPWMRRWIRHLGKFGDVHTFAWFDAENRPSYARLVDFHLEQLQGCRADYERVVLVGKSLGAWTSCGVAARTKIDGVVCLGYPLTEPSDPAPVRQEPLAELPVPGLVVYGSRDPVCPREVLELTMAQNCGLTSHCMPKGDHSLMVGGEASDQADAERNASAVIGAFLRSNVFERER